MHRFEHRGEHPLRVDVGTGGNADGPSHRRSQIRQDVAEQVGTDNDIEPIRVLHEVRAQNIDVVLVGTDVGILRGHLGEAFVPVWHGVDDAVRLGGGRDVFLRPGHCQFEGVFDDAVGAVAGEHALLGDEFAVGAGEHAAAD